ncbi:MAG: tetratricopeptide repeat protein [Acidobacteriota bacterium]|nr:tetratricopeptide repeat protein [Acidobacteriota bacterium]
MVSLQSRGATINSIYADTEGRFGFSSLISGSYNIVVNEEDYAPFNQRVDLNPVFSQTANVAVTLTPRLQKPNDPGAARVAGSNPGVIDQKEYSRRFPSKALKEYEKGLKASSEGHSDKAKEHFERSLKLAPDFYPAHNALGANYMAKSDFSAAQREFEVAIRLNQSDAEAYLNLANVMLLTKNYDLSAKNVEEGLRKQPGSAMGQFIIGSIYEHMMRYTEAEDALGKALRLDPTMGKVHLELVNLYLAQHKKTEASAELRTFLNDFPNDPFAPRARQVLDRLKK